MCQFGLCSSSRQEIQNRVVVQAERLTPHSVRDCLCFKSVQQPADGSYKLLELICIDDGTGVAARPRRLQLC